MNHVILNGSISNLKTFTYGDKKGIKFGLSYRKAKDDYKFFNCISFGKTAELIEKYIKNKDRITISGKLDRNDWEDQNGNQRTSYVIIVNEFTFPPFKEKKETKTDTYVPPTPPDEVPDFPF